MRRFLAGVCFVLPYAQRWREFLVNLHKNSLKNQTENQNNVPFRFADLGVKIGSLKESGRRTQADHMRRKNT